MQSQTQKVKKTDIVVRQLRERDLERQLSLLHRPGIGESRPIGGRSHLERSPLPEPKRSNPPPLEAYESGFTKEST